MQKNNKHIPSAGPSITNKEIQLVTQAVKYGWYEKRNMHLEQFVEKFSTYTGMKYHLPVSHCTAAIHLALLGLKIGPGDEVIVPDLTWVASAAPIHYVSAMPVFVDMDPKNWCIDPKSFEKAITKKTKAVIVADLYGNMPEMDEIKKIAQTHKIPIIEDAAEAIGATYKGQRAGTFGNISVFSFNATKLMMAGQGGLLATNNKKIYKRCKKLSHHGMIKYTPETTFWSVEIGYNYQWTNIQAALGLAQLRRLPSLIAQRRKIFKWYYDNLKNIDGLQFNYQAPYIKNTYWVTCIILGGQYKIKKEKIMAEFKKYNIDTRPFFYPISSMPAYRQYVKGKNMKKINPISYEISAYGFSPPSAACLTKQNIDYVCAIFRKILSKYK